MKNIIALFITYFILLSLASAQVPVSQEPRHKVVLQNKYIRLLDVWIPPGDTTQFHVHSTPSLFLHFTNRNIATQVKGGDWVKEQTVAGNVWYRSFINDTLVHRVCNLDSIPFHVTDIEILSSFNNDSGKSQMRLPFPVLFENENAIAYRLTHSAFSKKRLKSRGPIIVELVTSDVINFHNTKSGLSKKINAGKFLYIEPGTSFYLSIEGKEEINLVLFEIK